MAAPDKRYWLSATVHPSCIGCNAHALEILDARGSCSSFGIFGVSEGAVGYGWRGSRARRRFRGPEQAKGGVAATPNRGGCQSPSGRGAVMTLAVALHRGSPPCLRFPLRLPGCCPAGAALLRNRRCRAIRHAGVGSSAASRDCTVTGMLEAAGRPASGIRQPRARLLRAPALATRRVGLGSARTSWSRRSSQGRRAAAPGRRRHAVRLLRAAACGPADTTCTTARSPRGPGGARAAATAGSSSLVVQLDCLGGRPVGLLDPFWPSAPKDNEHADRALQQPELARDADRHGPRAAPGPVSPEPRHGRRVRDEGVARAAERATVTTRMRANAACLRARAAPHRQEARPARAQGRPTGQPHRTRRDRRVHPGSRSPARTDAAALEHVWSTSCRATGRLHPPSPGHADPQAGPHRRRLRRRDRQHRHGRVDRSRKSRAVATGALPTVSSQSRRVVPPCACQTSLKLG